MKNTSLVKFGMLLLIPAATLIAYGVKNSQTPGGAEVQKESAQKPPSQNTTASTVPAEESTYDDNDRVPADANAPDKKRRVKNSADKDDPMTNIQGGWILKSYEFEAFDNDAERKENAIAGYEDKIAHKTVFLFKADQGGYEGDFPRFNFGFLNGAMYTWKPGVLPRQHMPLSEIVEAGVTSKFECKFDEQGGMILQGQNENTRLKLVLTKVY